MCDCHLQHLLCTHQNQRMTNGKVCGQRMIRTVLKKLQRFIIVHGFDIFLSSLVFSWISCIYGM